MFVQTYLVFIFSRGRMRGRPDPNRGVGLQRFLFRRYLIIKNK